MEIIKILALMITDMTVQFKSFWIVIKQGLVFPWVSKWSRLLTTHISTCYKGPGMAERIWGIIWLYLPGP